MVCESVGWQGTACGVLDWDELHRRDRRLRLEHNLVGFDTTYVWDRDVTLRLQSDSNVNSYGPSHI